VTAREKTISIACAITATPGPTTWQHTGRRGDRGAQKQRDEAEEAGPEHHRDRQEAIADEALDAATPVTPAMRPVPGRCACTSVSWIALAAWSPRRLRSCAMIWPRAASAPKTMPVIAERGRYRSLGVFMRRSAPRASRIAAITNA
jgi:hypothetical protein